MLLTDILCYLWAFHNQALCGGGQDWLFFGNQLLSEKLRGVIFYRKKTLFVPLIFIWPLHKRKSYVSERLGSKYHLFCCTLSSCGIIIILNTELIDAHSDSVFFKQQGITSSVLRWQWESGFSLAQDCCWPVRGDPLGQALCQHAYCDAKPSKNRGMIMDTELSVMLARPNWWE